MGRSEADKRFEKTLRALGFAVLRMQRASELEDGDGVRLTGVRFNLVADNRTSVLAILQGVGGEGELVAFVGGPDLESTVYAVGKALTGKALRWREDRPYGGVVKP